MSMARIVLAVALIVAIHIVQTESGACPEPPSHPTPIRSADGDGTYSYNTRIASDSLLSRRSIWEWHELWTDLPERGGRFIEQMTERTCRR